QGHAHVLLPRADRAGAHDVRGLSSWPEECAQHIPPPYQQDKRLYLQETRLDRSRSSPVRPSAVVLELVAQRNLHAPRSAQHLRVITERRGVFDAGVQRSCIEVSRIGDIEDFPAELQLVVLRVGHPEALGEAKVQAAIAIRAKDVPLAALAGGRKAELLYSFIWKREQVGIGAAAGMGSEVHVLRGWARAGCQTQRIGADGCASGIALQVPIGRPTAPVNDVCRNTGVGADDAGNLPAADNAIDNAREV